MNFRMYTQVRSWFEQLKGNNWLEQEHKLLLDAIRMDFGEPSLTWSDLASIHLWFVSYHNVLNRSPQCIEQLYAFLDDLRTSGEFMKPSARLNRLDSDMQMVKAALAELQKIANTHFVYWNGSKHTIHANDPIYVNPEPLPLTQALNAEREACAQVCDAEIYIHENHMAAQSMAALLAGRIRRRKTSQHGQLFPLGSVPNSYIDQKTSKIIDKTIRENIRKQAMQRAIEHEQSIREDERSWCEIAIATISSDSLKSSNPEFHHGLMAAIEAVHNLKRLDIKEQVSHERKL